CGAHLDAGRRRPFAARPGIRLDADMSRAIEKLGRMQATIDSLPGRDCGACGAPTCAALAEDIVMQRAERGLCPYVASDESKEGGVRPMRLRELARILDLEELTPQVLAPARPGEDGLEEDPSDPLITRAYASDLLSDVLANAPAGGILITLQVHLNVIAVASHAELHAVIFSCGRRPEDDVIERAAGEELALFASRADTFELAGRLYELGLRGSPA
ncbi:conserved hypothetical protein, partial [sediment metagenome]